MRITPDSVPAHVARAYGLRPGSPALPFTPAPQRAQESVHRDDVVDVRNSSSAESATELVAAQVNKPVDFTAGPRAESSPQAIPFYRHPADRNAAATSIEAGRVLDVSG